jgi:hypothetical protein
MLTNRQGLFAIALYVPDQEVEMLSDAEMSNRAILTGVPDLDFLPPPWWERSHTVRLGVAPDGDS